MGSIGGLEWIVIGLAVLLLFGAKRIPELARGLGQGISEFRKASEEIKREIDEGKRDPKPVQSPRSEPAPRQNAEVRPESPATDQPAPEEKSDNPEA